MRETGTVQTNFGMGTPGYISPEQFYAESIHDTRSDIFSLGVTLYELLCGKLPYAQPVTNLVEAAKAISDDDFVLLSRNLDGCPADLEAIAHKCLRIEPKDRYQSVEMLVDDLERFLANDEVQARQRTRLEATRYWIAKNPWMSASLICASVSLILVTLLSVIYWRNAADTAASLAALRKSDRAARSELDAELAVRRRSALNQVLANSDRNWHRNPGVVDSWLDGAVKAGLAKDSFAWRVMKHRTKRVIKEFQAHDSPVTQLSVSADGSRLASASEGVLTVWSLDDGRQLLSRSIEPLHVRDLSLAPDGERLLVQDRNVLTLFDVNTGTVLNEIPTHSHGRWLTGFSPAGDLVFSAGTSNQVTVLEKDLKSIASTMTAPFRVVKYARISPDSSRLLAINPRRQYVVWDIASGEIQFEGSAEKRSVRTFSATKDFSTLATAEAFTNLFVIGTESDEVETIMSRGERFDHLLFSPDQQWLLSVGRNHIDGRASEARWEVQWTRTLSESPTSVHFMPQSDAYLVGRKDGRIQTCLVEAEPLDKVLAKGIIDPRALSLLSLIHISEPTRPY